MNSGEESALPMVSSLSSVSKKVRGHRVAGLHLKEDFSSLWLITYKKCIFSQGTKLLSWRSASGILPHDVHMEEEVQVKVQVEEEKIGETHGGEQGEE